MRTGCLQSSWIKFSTVVATSSVTVIFGAIPILAFADVRISEFVYDAPGSDERHEWIEIFNDGQMPVDISKWKISDTSRHVLNSPPKNGSIGTTTLQPSAYAILADDAGFFSTSYPGATVSILDTSISIQNAKGAISLIDASGKVHNSVAYSDSLGATGNGNSLQRTSAGEWIEAKPTPGFANAEVASPVVTKPIVLTPKKSAAAKKEASKATKKLPNVGPRNVAEQGEASESRVDEAATDSPAVAAAATPAKSPVSPWFLGMLGIAGAAAIAGVAARRSKKEEWEIIEETD